MSASANEEATAREDTTMKRDHRSKAAQNRQEVKAVVVGFPVQACAPFRPKPVRITELTKANAAILQKFFAKSLISLRRSFHARRNVVNSYGDVIDLGPDYRTRIAALHTLLDICTRGRQSLASEKSSYGVSWEEIKAYAEHINLPGMNPSRPESASAPAALRASGSGDRPSGEARNPGSNGVRICDLTNAHGEEIEELFAIGFASLEGVDEARRTSLNREGDLIDLGLDHVVGRAALQLQIEISTRGRKQLAVPRSPVRRAGTGFTKAELEEIGQRFTRTWEFKALGEDHDSSQFDY